MATSYLTRSEIQELLKERASREESEPTGMFDAVMIQRLIARTVLTLVRLASGKAGVDHRTGVHHLTL